MMECPDCGREMIWQNDWDIDEGIIQTDFICGDQENCELHLSIYRKIK